MPLWFSSSVIALWIASNLQSVLPPVSLGHIQEELLFGQSHLPLSNSPYSVRVRVSWENDCIGMLRSFLMNVKLQAWRAGSQLLYSKVSRQQSYQTPFLHSFANLKWNSNVLIKSLGFTMASHIGSQWFVILSHTAIYYVNLFFLACLFAPKAPNYSNERWLYTPEFTCSAFLATTPAHKREHHVCTFGECAWKRNHSLFYHWFPSASPTLNFRFSSPERSH